MGHIDGVEHGPPTPDRCGFSYKMLDLYSFAAPNRTQRPQTIEFEAALP